MGVFVMLLWLVNVVFDIGGQFVFKVVVSDLQEGEGLQCWKYMFGCFWLWIGIVCYVFEFVVWIVFLLLVLLFKGVLLGLINIVVLMIVGCILFCEKFMLLWVIGMLLVIVGVVVVGVGL